MPNLRNGVASVEREGVGYDGAPPLDEWLSNVRTKRFID